MRLRKSAAVLAALILALSVSACTGGPGVSSTVSSSVSLGEASSAQSEAPAMPGLPLAMGTSPLTGLPLPEGAVPNQRPVSVMVANTERAFPQRGLAQAELMYEMLTEGGITRLMAVYPSHYVVPQVGPVRSTRDQFVQFAVPMNSVHVHIGSSVYARNLLNTLSYQDVDGLYLGTTAFLFDQQRTLPKTGGKLNENCWFTDAALIGQGIAATQLPAEGEVHDVFHFVDEPLTQGEKADWVNFTYSAVTNVAFGYDPENSLYTKMAFTGPHADEDGALLTYTNVILLFAEITLKPDGLCTEFDLRQGEGLYFNGGQVVPITWKKGAPTDALRLFGPTGEELGVQRGKSYIGILPLEQGEALTYGANEPAASAPASAPAEPPPASVSGAATVPQEDAVPIV